MRSGRAPAQHLISVLLALTLMGHVASAHEARPPSQSATGLLRIAITFQGTPLSPRVEASAMDEVRWIWAPYGVDVFASGPDSARRDSDLSLAVIVADRPDRPMTSGALGSILFLDDEPQTTVTMYQEAIDTLLSTVTIAGSHNLQWPTAFHDLIEGRVLGRGLAHEIGHFLLRARHHSDRGLMRAPHRVPDLVGGDRQQFALSPDDRSRLVSCLATAGHLSPDSARPSGTQVH